MNFESKMAGRYMVVTVLEPRFGADRAVSFKESVSKLIEKGQLAFVLDLSQVEFIDSTGLGAILSVLKRIGKSGEIVICGATHDVASMFKLTRMDRVFRMYPTVEEAISAAV